MSRWLKTKPNVVQEAGHQGSPVRAILSCTLNQPTNQPTCKQVNSFSQLGLWVLGSRGPGTVSRRGSALSALQSPCPASPAVPSASGLCLSLHYLIHSSPQLPPPFHTQARCFFSSELFSDIGHWVITVRYNFLTTQLHSSCSLRYNYEGCPSTCSLHCTYRQGWPLILYWMFWKKTRRHDKVQAPSRNGSWSVLALIGLCKF